MSGPVEARPVPLGVLWFALLGGPVAWTAHLLASYPLVPLACRLGTTTPLNLLTAVTALIAAASAGAGVWAYRRAGSAGHHSAAESRAGFMGITGALLGLLFAFAILMAGLAPLLQDPCLQGLR